MVRKRSACVQYNQPVCRVHETDLSAVCTLSTRFLIAKQNKTKKNPQTSPQPAYPQRKTVSVGGVAPRFLAFLLTELLSKFQKPVRNADASCEERNIFVTGFPK